MSETKSNAVKYLVFGGIAAMTIATAVAAHAADQGGRNGQRGPMGRDHMGSRCERLEARLAQVDRHLTPDRVRDMLAGHLARDPEQNLKVGKVTEKDGVIEAQIVTKEGSLVTTRTVSAKTGFSPDAVKTCKTMTERFEKMREAHGGAQGGAEAKDGDHRGGHRFGHGGPGGGRGMRMHRDGRDDLNLGIAGNAGPGHDLNLSTAQAKTLVEASLLKAGNPRLKVGAVKEKDADTITVDVVTTENSLVARREVDRHTGHMRHAQGA